MFWTYLINTQRYKFTFQIKDWLSQSSSITEEIFSKEYHMQEDITPAVPTQKNKYNLKIER